MLLKHMGQTRRTLGHELGCRNFWLVSWPGMNQRPIQSVRMTVCLSVKSRCCFLSVLRVCDSDHRSREKQGRQELHTWLRDSTLGASWRALLLAGPSPLPVLSPCARPDLALSYPFLDNSVPHIRQHGLERLGKIYPVLPPNGSNSLKAILQHHLDITEPLGPLSNIIHQQWEPKRRW